MQDKLVWIDCEMTGLDLKSDLLIEIAVLVTDSELNFLGDGLDVVIHAGDDAMSSMVEVVTQMHTKSGLINEVRASTTDVATAEAMVLTSLETGFTLDVPLSGPRRPGARVGRRGDDLVVAAAGVSRVLPLPPVLRRCHAVEAMRSERGLCVRFTPDAALWREPDASVA